MVELDWTLEKQQREAEAAAEADWQLNLPHDICLGRGERVQAPRRGGAREQYPERSGSPQRHVTS